MRTSQEKELRIGVKNSNCKSLQSDSLYTLHRRLTYKNEFLSLITVLILFQECESGAQTESGLSLNPSTILPSVCLSLLTMHTFTSQGCYDK